MPGASKQAGRRLRTRIATIGLVVTLAAACAGGNTPADGNPPAEQAAQPSATSAETTNPTDREPSDDSETQPDSAPPAEPATGPSTSSSADTETANPPDDIDPPDPAELPDPAGEVEPEPAEIVEPKPLDPKVVSRLGSLLEELVGIATGWNPTGRASIAVVTPGGDLYGLNEHRQHVSASSVKPLWAAAAIEHAGVEAVEPLAHGALVQSDNFLAGELLDLVGIDTVNAWTREFAGLTGTHLAAWSFGAERVSQSVLNGGTKANLTTVADLAQFYALLRRDELLPAEDSTALESWLRATPRASSAGGATGALLARLPDRVSAEALHKAGWLPPYCCSAEVRLVIDGGVIPLADGNWFAIAAVADRGEAYNLSLDWVAFAACRVYLLLASDETHTCDRYGDGVPRPEMWPPPPPEPDPETPDEPDPPPEPDPETPDEPDPPPEPDLETPDEPDSEPDDEPDLEPDTLEVRPGERREDEPDNRQ